MISVSRKIVIGAIAALALATAVPAEVQAQHWRGGRGGWNGGGWQAGGWQGGGGWHGGGWRGRRGHSGNWVGPAIAGVIGGLALGALATGASPYGPAYYGPRCTWQDRPAYDPWGQFVGYRTVQVCY